jgi:lysophospholipase L1-like esterase
MGLLKPGHGGGGSNAAGARHRLGRVVTPGLVLALAILTWLHPGFTAQELDAGRLVLVPGRARAHDALRLAARFGARAERLAELIGAGGLAAVRTGIAAGGAVAGRLPAAAEFVAGDLGLAGRPHLEFLQPRAGLRGAPETATLTVPGPGGSFTVPYIQTGAALRWALAVGGAGGDDRLEVTLDAGTPAARVEDASIGDPRGVFSGIGFGEHTLTARLLRAGPGGLNQLGGGERVVARARLDRVARGDVVAAIGDSTTEGVGGGPWSGIELESLAAFPDWLAARAAAARAGQDWVTADGRGFPEPSNLQYPGRSRPSYTVDLTRLLESARGRPALVLNLGFSGGTSDSWVHVAESPLVVQELRAVPPDAWLINLGVNDALVGRSPSDYQSRMGRIVADLERLDGASPAQIHLACPIWAKQPARHRAEQAYLPAIDQLRASLGLGPAPDLFTWYRDHPEDVADAVHPNAAGYEAMAELWLHALQGANAGC